MTSPATASSARTPAVSTHPTDRAVWHRPALALDAAACAVLGAGLLAAPAGLLDGLAIATATPLRLVGAALLVAAVANAWAARADGRGPTHLAVALDVVFAAVSSVLLVTLSGDAAGWARALLAAGIAVPAGYAVAKVVGLRPSAAGRAGR